MLLGDVGLTTPVGSTPAAPGGGAAAGETAPGGAAAVDRGGCPATSPVSRSEKTCTMKPPFAPRGTGVVLVRVSVPVPLSNPRRNRPVLPENAYWNGSRGDEPVWAGICSEMDAVVAPPWPGEVRTSLPVTVPAWARSSLTNAQPRTRTGPSPGIIPDPLNWNRSIRGELRSTRTE